MAVELFPWVRDKQRNRSCHRGCARSSGHRLQEVYGRPGRSRLSDLRGSRASAKPRAASGRPDSRRAPSGSGGCSAQLPSPEQPQPIPSEVPLEQAWRYQSAAPPLVPRLVVLTVALPPSHPQAQPPLLSWLQALLPSAPCIRQRKRRRPLAQQPRQHREG